MRSPAYNVEPGANRSGRLLMAVTATSPFKPCARPMRPTSSKVLFRDVDADAYAFGRARRPCHLTHRLDDAATLADDATQIARARVHEQRHAVAALGGVDENTIGV